VYGAQIAATVLGIPEISKQWAQDLITMSSRIKSMRQKLYDELVRLETPGDWSHIIKQSGMFGYTGISPVQIKHLQGSCYSVPSFRNLLTAQQNITFTWRTLHGYQSLV
jgi:aspartate/tyrosine/aromatic aminotransferase